MIDVLNQDILRSVRLGSLADQRRQSLPADVRGPLVEVVVDNATHPWPEQLLTWATRHHAALFALVDEVEKAALQEPAQGEDVWRPHRW
jgi:hypothetical protein